MKRLRLISLWFISLCCFDVWAQDTILSGDKPADVRLVIDISGSMKQNDPEYLRRPALDLVVKLLPDGSQAGVWAFGKYVNMLVPLKPVDQAWRDNASSKTDKISSLGLFTNIGQALEKASYENSPDKDKFQRSIILLTDGMVDIAKDPEVNEKEWRRIVDVVLPKLKDAGFTIHTIALSDNADTDLMNKLALATGGISAVAHSAEDLMKIFLKAFDQAVPAEQVPLNENRFVVDSSVEEFTALIFRKPGSSTTELIAPDETRYRFSQEKPDVNWYQADNYDLITVNRPLEGEWQVIADMDPDSRVTVVSDLNLRVKPLPNNVFVGQTLDFQLALQEDGTTITRKDFLQLLTIEAMLDREEDGQQWPAELSKNLIPTDGIYRSELNQFDRTGEYQLSVFVDGKSLKREYSKTLSVRQPFTIDLKQQSKSGNAVFLLTVTPNDQNIDVAATRVTAKLKKPSGAAQLKPLMPSNYDNWQLEIIPSEDGEYIVDLKITVADQTGNTYKVTPGSLSFSYPPSDSLFEIQTPEPIAEPEPEAEPEPDAVAELEVDTVAEDRDTEKDTEKEQDPSSEWLMWGGIALGNILIFSLAFVAYRMIMGGNKDDDLGIDDIDDDTDAAAKTNPAEAAKAAPVPEEPPMDDMSMEDLDEDMASIEEPAPAEVDQQVAEELADGVDLSSDDDDMAMEAIDDEPAPESKEPLKTSGDQEFSLDDFELDDEDD